MYIGKKIISKKSIVSTMSQNYIYEHPQIQTNDLCICDSGKKYKKCCMKKYEIVQRIMHDIKNPKAVAYSIPGVKVSEMAIEVFSGQEKDLKNSKNKELIKQMEEMIQRRREEE